MEDRTKAHDDRSFRACAEECRRLAARTADPVERQHLHYVADQWLKLAQVAGVAQEHPRLGADNGGTSYEGTSAEGHLPDRDAGSYEIERKEKAWLWPTLAPAVDEVQEPAQPNDERR
jgi:hypothetical protein